MIRRLHRQPTGSAGLGPGSVRTLPPTKGVGLNPVPSLSRLNSPNLFTVMLSEDGIYDHVFHSLAKRQSFQSSVTPMTDLCFDVSWE